MKKSYFFLVLAALMILSIASIVGCGSNATGGGNTPGGTVFTADIYVSTTGSDEAPIGDGSLAKPYRTIQKAMNVVQANKVIGVLAGVYTEEVTWTGSADVTLRGVNRNTVTIEVQATKRGIKILSGVPAGQIISIESMTITGAATALDGVGINIEPANITAHLKDLIIKYARATVAGKGGGVYLKDPSGKLVVESCIFSNNYSVDLGSAICSYGETAIIYSSFNNNYSANQATVYIYDGATGVYVYASTFEANYAAGYGGAIRNDNNNITVEGCSFLYNSADVGDAAISIVSSVLGKTAVIRNSEFCHNRAGSGGYGAVSSTMYTEIDRCTFYDNTSEASGGAVHVYPTGSYARITNSVFVNNKAKGTGNGGGIDYYRNNSSLEVINCTFVSNESGGTGTGPAIYINNATGSNLVNNIFQNNVGSTAPQVAVGSGIFGLLYNNMPENGVSGGVSSIGIGNVTNEVAEFVNYPTDMHLHASCPPSIKNGGTFEVSGITIPDYDLEGTLRSKPYSMGAFEKD